MHSRPCIYPEDQKEIVGLLLKYRAASTVDTYFTAWRLRLLLSSRVWDAGQDARIWENAAGRIVGFAMLWRRRVTSPYLVLDRLVDPDYVTDDLLVAILQWGTRRACALADVADGPITVYTGRLASAIHADQQLERFGFTPVTPNPKIHNVYLTLSLESAVPEPELPAGYALQPLQSRDEIEAYEGLNDFAAVNREHRHETLSSDEYGYIVVVDPSGLFVAHCEYSICRQEWQQSGQRLGWIDYIGTHPDHRRRGLGRAVLLKGVQCLRALGAESARLVTISTNSQAIGLYETTGFTAIAVEEAPRYENRVSGSGARSSAKKSC